VGQFSTHAKFIDEMLDVSRWTPLHDERNVRGGTNTNPGTGMTLECPHN